MIVYDVVCNGECVETIRPLNQRPREMYWFVVDRLQCLKEKYGSDVVCFRRYIQMFDC